MLSEYTIIRNTEWLFRRPLLLTLTESVPMIFASATVYYASPTGTDVHGTSREAPGSTLTSSASPNCISLDSQSGDQLQNDVTAQGHNSWNNGLSVKASDFESLDVENLILNDRQPDGTLPETPLLRLKPTATKLTGMGW